MSQRSTPQCILVKILIEVNFDYLPVIASGASVNRTANMRRMDDGVHLEANAPPEYGDYERVLCPVRLPDLPPP